MAIALLTNTGGALGVTGGTTSAINTTGASLIVIGLAYNFGSTPTVSDSESNTWTALTPQTDASTVTDLLYYCVSPTTSATHTFTVSGSALFASIGVASFSGTALSSPVDQQNGSGFGGGGTPGSITPTQANELIVSSVGINSGGAAPMVTVLSPLTAVAFGSANHYGVGLAYEVQTTATAINPTWTSTGTSGMATVIASFKAPAAVVPGNLLALL